MKKQYDVLIIGSGIAGMTAAIYLKRFNMEVAVLEKEYPGGQLAKISKIENYPGFLEISGFDLADNIYKQMKQLEIPILFEKVISIKDLGSKKVIETSNEIYESKYVVIASGRKPKKLGLEKEDTLLGKGISYCATCDGPLYKEKDVIVVGGGNSALQEALYLSTICNHVTLIHRRNTFRANELLVSKVVNSTNISIKYNSVINTLYSENGVFSGVKITENDQESSIKAAGLFIYIGMEVEKDIFKELSICQENGYIKANQNGETHIKNVYACGDVIEKNTYQLTAAAGEAATVATSLHLDYINSQE